ncbi:ABC transporter permease [Acidiphilium sp. JA12-A1]|uniref:ABC transporter permease n=1 Tax=Acidiphilium sp. JA12-A1 TaxID=1464546 RepID=UPI0009EC9120|nr:ABC transporter permease [Acidiphilium sp. JA12-A1]
MMTGLRKSRVPAMPAVAMLLPATLLVLGALVVPTLILLRYSFNRFSPTALMEQAFTLSNYARFFTDSYYHQVMLTTFLMALSCTFAAAVLGFPVAYMLARTRSRFKSLLVILTVFPLLVGNVVRAAGWMAFMGGKGFVSGALQWLGLAHHGVDLMYTFFAVFIGTLSVVLPFMILTLQSVLEGIDYSVADAAQNLGASPAITFRRIILPLALPGIVAGSVLVFILCMNAYATPFLLGGPSFKMMAPALYQQIEVASNWPFGAALAFILMIVTIGATVLSTALLQRRIRGVRA